MREPDRRAARGILKGDGRDGQEGWPEMDDQIGIARKGLPERAKNAVWGLTLG